MLGGDKRLKLQWWIETRDKPGLLWAFLRHFGKDSRVSFEGDLATLRLAEVPGASTAETAVLRRQTTHPTLDFVVIPVTPSALQILHERLSVSGLFQNGGALVHVQVEHEGHLVLGAYDNFHKDCVVAYEPTPVALLEQLKARGVIRSYDVAA
jgi:hypothetical protein